MPVPWNDPRLRQIWLFARRFASQPYFDLDSVPAVLAMSRQRQVFWRWMQILALLVLVLVAVSSAYTLSTNPRQFDGFQAFCDVTPSLAILAAIRFALIRVRASFGPADVTVEENGNTWTEPIKSFNGVSWILFTTVSNSRLFPTSGTSAYSEVSTSTVMSHHWIGLVHPDPRKTLTLAVSMKEGQMYSLLQRYSRYLNLPILARGEQVRAG